MDKEELKKKAEQYISNEQNDDFRGEVESLLDNEKYDELEERFYTELEFGTGGIRGVIGGGLNRMNTFIIRRTTQGLANYARKQSERPSVVIAYDSRRYSKVFALEAALVMCANGIKAYLFTSLRPTPELSYAVRKLKTTTGIVVTASHNPPEYNGYKVYWSDGAQIVHPHDQGIIDEVKNVKTPIPRMEENEAVEKGLLTYIDREIDDAFVAMAKNVSLRPELFREKEAASFDLVYTPLHGTGAMLVERVLGELGLGVTTVPEQREPDGEFPTVKFPNPEEASALKLALELGKKENANLVVGTDPDADRIGIAVPRGNGEYALITGNQLGALLADYAFSTLTEQDAMPEKPYFIKTVVTTELQDLIAQKYGVEVYDTLTGFKHIASKIREFEDSGSGKTFILGGEESYGYMIGSEVRDKDSISSTVLTVEMALYNHLKGMSLLDRLEAIYREHGYFEEIMISKYFRGMEGLPKMKKLMESFRNNPPASLGGQKVTEIKDYLTRETIRVAENRRVKDIELPASNVLKFRLEDQSTVSVRPSGTEPKIKFYASCRSRNDDLDTARKKVREKLDKIEQEINSVLEKAEA
ncbi:MAG: phospho-sugar mutase [Spirochaetia bacterium]